MNEPHIIDRTRWAGVALCLGLGACLPDTAAFYENEPRGPFELVPLDLRIDLPADNEIVNLPDRRVSITLDPKTRHPRWMEILPAAEPTATFAETAGNLRYQTLSVPRHDGTNLCKLRGRITISGTDYEVSCAEESEGLSTLSWCFVYLLSLRRPQDAASAP